MQVFAQAHETGAPQPLVSVAAKLFSGYEAAIAAMTRARASFQPNLAMKTHYDQRYEFYREAADAIQPLWAKLTAKADFG